MPNFYTGLPILGLNRPIVDLAKMYQGNGECEDFDDDRLVEVRLGCGDCPPSAKFLKHEALVRCREVEQKLLELRIKRKELELSNLQRYVESLDSITDADEVDHTQVTHKMPLFSHSSSPLADGVPQRLEADQTPDFTRGHQNVDEIHHS